MTDKQSRDFMKGLEQAPRRGDAEWSRAAPSPEGAQQAVAELAALVLEGRKWLGSWANGDVSECCDCGVNCENEHKPGCSIHADWAREARMKELATALTAPAAYSDPACQRAQALNREWDAGFEAGQKVAATPAPEASPSAKEGEWRFFNVYADTEVRNAADNKLLAVICAGPEKKRILQALKDLTTAGGDS